MSQNTIRVTIEEWKAAKNMVPANTRIVLDKGKGKQVVDLWDVDGVVHPIILEYED